MFCSCIRICYQAVLLLKVQIVLLLPCSSNQWLLKPSPFSRGIISMGLHPKDVPNSSSNLGVLTCSDPTDRSCSVRLSSEREAKLAVQHLQGYTLRKHSGGAPVDLLVEVSLRWHLVAWWVPEAVILSRNMGSHILNFKLFNIGVCSPNTDHKSQSQSLKNSTWMVTTP